MEFGMPTLIENRDLQESAQLCSELGLAFIELNMNLPQYQTERICRVYDLREIAERYHIYYTIHLDENLNVCDFNHGVAEAYQDTVKRAVQAAEKLNIPLLNMHMNKGVYFTLPDRRVYVFEQYKDRYLCALQEFRDLCDKLVKDSGILISIENTDGFRSFQREGIELLLESSVFSLTWDIGHSHAAREMDGSFITKHMKRVRHFHIHDGSGIHNHLPLGTGEIDLVSRLGLAEENGCRCVLETKTVQALRESVEWLNHHGYPVKALPPDGGTREQEAVNERNT